MNNKFIFNFTPNGMIPTRDMTPHVPVSPDEIVTQVLEVAALGVNMVHLHARDPITGEPTYRKEVFADIIHGVRNQNKDLVLCVTTSGRLYSEYEMRSDVLNLEGTLKPDCASLTLSSLNFNKQASVNTPQMIQDLARMMSNRNIMPELEAFDLGMINYAKYLIKKKLLTPPHYFNLILGNIACAQANMLSLGLLIKELPAGSFWSVGAVGSAQLKMNVLALVSGGGVGVGLEDNIWYDNDRTRLATNRDLVERISAIAATLGCTPYSPKELRRIFKL